MTMCKSFSFSRLRLIVPGFLILAVSQFTFAATFDEQALIDKLKKGGAVLLIRHALAPGIGDPQEFDVNDCSTQRNLNDEGREQARAIGQWLRKRGINNVKVYSSQWCRCLETARLMNLGSVTPLPALNSFFERSEDREPNISALKQFVHENTKPDELIIMVTHQVTISEITDKWTDSGHGKLVRPDQVGGIELLGELDFQ
jgi:phosphohistidine phosphatase SixA